MRHIKRCTLFSIQTKVGLQNKAFPCECIFSTGFKNMYFPHIIPLLKSAQLGFFDSNTKQKPLPV